MAITIRNVVLGQDGAGSANFSLRNVTPLLGDGQDQVRVTYHANSTLTTAVANCSVGILTGGAADTASTPVELLFSGSHGFSISANSTITSDWANLTGFTQTDSLVCICDFGASNANDRRDPGISGSNCYTKSATASYNSTSSTGFSSNPSLVLLVTKIEVQSAAASTIYTNALPTGNSSSDGYSLRNICPVTASGKDQARVVFYSGTSAPTLVAAHCSIGIWDGTSNVPNTVSTPVELLFGGGHGFSLATGLIKTSDWVNLTGFTNANDLVVIIDVTSGNYGADTGATGTTGCFKAASSTYNSASGAGFTASANTCRVNGIIEVQSVATVLPTGWWIPQGFPGGGDRAIGY